MSTALNNFHLSQSSKDTIERSGQKAWTGIKWVGGVAVVIAASAAYDGHQKAEIRKGINDSKTAALLRLVQAPLNQNIIDNVENTCRNLGGTCLSVVYDPKTHILSATPTVESLAKSLSQIVDKNCPMRTHSDGPEICEPQLNYLRDTLPLEPAAQKVKTLEQ